MAPNNKRKTGGAQLPTPPSAFIALCAAKGIIVPTATAEWLKLRHLTGPDYSTAAAKKDAAAAWAWARANASVGADGSVVADWSSLPTAAAAFVRKITANPYKTNTDSEDVAGAKLVQLMDGLPSSATPAPVTPATATAPLASAPRHNLNAQQVAALELLFGPIDSLSDVELASMVSRALPAAAPQTPLPPPIVTPAPAAATAAVATAAPATPAGPMLVPSTPYTQDQICAGLGARHTLFALYLTWTADQRKAWAVQAKNANAGGGFSFPGEATLQGAYGFLLQVTQFLPASEDRERKLGEKLALVGRFQTPKRTGEEADIAFTDAFRARASTAWADLIAAGATGFEAAQGVLEPCFRIVNSHMTRRAGFMQGILQAGGLPALIPFFVTQAAAVATLREDAPSRHAEAYPKTSFAEDARSRNEAYHDLLAAFFKDIAGVRVMPGRFGPVALAAAAEAGSSLARSILFAGSPPQAQPYLAFAPAPVFAPAPPPAPWPMPPPSYAAPAAPLPAPLAPLPPAAAPRPPKLKAPLVLSPAGSAGLVGPTLKAYPDAPPGKGCRCVVYAAAPHWHFECPLRLAALFGHPCPGFDAAGGRAPADWVGADLSPAACANWRTLVARHGLTGPRMTNGRFPAF
jgi:hypothetical protein